MPRIFSPKSLIVAVLFLTLAAGTGHAVLTQWQAQVASQLNAIRTVLAAYGFVLSDADCVQLCRKAGFERQVTLAASCIEAGRWGFSRPGFAAAGRVLTQEIRYGKAETVTRSLKERHDRSSDQRLVWKGVDKMLFALGAASPTNALSNGFEARSNAIADYLAAFKVQPGQIGVIYKIDGVLAGLDLLGSEGSFAWAYPKLVRGSALQALAGYRKEGYASLHERDFLNAALSAPAQRFPAVGLGEELRIDTDGIGGAALQLDGGLVHLFAYPRWSGG